MDGSIATLAARLRDGGFVAAEEEAALLVAAVGADAVALEAAVRRRLDGEPLAWIVGRAVFCGLPVVVHTGVYVPRPHSEALAWRAVEALPVRGVAIDLCCGSGAIAAVLRHHRPEAVVVACDVDERAVACARANGLDARAGDLLGAVPQRLRGGVDVLVGVVPYVPTPALPLLQRDTFRFESARSYDGGPDGTAILRRVLREARPLLRPGATVLLELGGDQHELLQAELHRLGYQVDPPLLDEEGDVRALVARTAAQ